MPAAAYTWLGLARVLVPPSPKVQAYEVIVPPVSVEVLVKVAVRPLVVSLKFATGLPGGGVVPPPKYWVT